MVEKKSKYNKTNRTWVQDKFNHNVEFDESDDNISKYWSENSVIDLCLDDDNSDNPNSLPIEYTTTIPSVIIDIEKETSSQSEAAVRQVKRPRIIDLCYQ